MLPPHELKKAEFTRVMRGYNASEVDEHLAFVYEKYTELYRENDALEQRLRDVGAQLDALKKDEAAIRGAMLSAQRAADAIVSEANERAEVVMRASKTNCDKIVDDFRLAIRHEQAQLSALRESVKAYKATLFSLYQEHIEAIAQIPTEAPELGAVIPTEEELVQAAVEDIKTHITDGLIQKEQSVSDAIEQPLPLDDAETVAEVEALFSSPGEEEQPDITCGKRSEDPEFFAPVTVSEPDREEILTEPESEAAVQTEAEAEVQAETEEAQAEAIEATAPQIPVLTLSEEESVSNEKEEFAQEMSASDEVAKLFSEALLGLGETEDRDEDILRAVQDEGTQVYSIEDDARQDPEDGIIDLEMPLFDEAPETQQRAKGGHIMESLAQVQSQMKKSPKPTSVPRKKTMNPSDFTDGDDGYDADLEEFMQSMKHDQDND